jgi:mono/diheme cytochrome c family protein
MRKTILFPVALVMALTLTCAVRSAQAADEKAGEATYTAKCKMCHGATGMANPAIAKMMNVEMKPLGGAEVQKLTNTDLSATIKIGKGKMKPVAGLTDAQIGDVVAYLRTLKK